MINCLYCDAEIKKVITKKEWKAYNNFRGVTATNFYKHVKNQELLLCPTCGKYQARLKQEIKQIENNNKEENKNQKLITKDVQMPENWKELNALQKLAWIDNELDKQGWKKW